MRFTSIYLKYFNTTEPPISHNFSSFQPDKDIQQGQFILKTKISRTAKKRSVTTFFVLDSPSTSDSEAAIQQLYAILPHVSIIKTDPLSAYSAGGVPLMQLYNQDTPKWI